MPISHHGNRIEFSTYGVATTSAKLGFTAGQTVAVCALGRTAATGRTARLRRVLVTVQQLTAASILRYELTAATNVGTATAVTSVGGDTGEAAAALSGWATFTVAPTVGTALMGQSYSLGVVGGSTDATKLTPTVLYDWQEGGETRPPMLHAGTAGGWVFQINSSAAIASTSSNGLIVQVEWRWTEGD